MSVASSIMDHYRRVFRKSSSYQKVFNTPEGEAVLGDIIRQSNLHGASYMPGDTHGTAYNEGERRLAQYIINMVRMSPDEVRRVAELAAKSDRHSQESDLYGEGTG